jgi:broad specificity phosphatase PhoE/hypoxanthine phosphoribosyltransferase
VTFLSEWGKNMDPLKIIGIVLGVIGALASLWFFYEKIIPIRRLSWKSAEKAARNIAEKMAVDSFSPNVIVGIGRGGAIMGAMISGCLGHRPLLVIDRKYAWIEGRRVDDMFLHLQIPPMYIEKVLLTAGETHTGNTTRLYYEYFRNLGAKEIRRATFYYQMGCTEPIEYIGVKTQKDLLLPWMFTEKYVRESRGEEEARGLTLLKTRVLIDRSETFGICFLVRHGESADNAAGDRYSGITDSVLTELGIRQAEDVGWALQGEHIERIYTSPMKRAVETARMVQSKTGGMLVVDNRLREIDYGNWEGLTRQEVFQRWPELYLAYKEDPIKNHPPGGENPKETFGRLLSLWIDIQKTMASENIKRFVIVTHKSIGRLLLCYITGQPLSKYRERRLDNSSITKLILDKSGKTDIEYENRTDHLSQKV